MKNYFTFILMFSISVLSQAAEMFPGKTGATLRSAIREQYTPSNYQTYFVTRTLMFGTIDNNDGKVELAYGTELFPINPQHPIPDHTIVNTEHTWPQSKFGHMSGPGMKTDLHHLFPSRNKTNSERGSKPFAELDDDTQTISFWINGQRVETKPGANEIDKYSESSAHGFEPEEDHKGNVARAMVYFFTIYENKSSLNKPFFLNQLMPLKAWHQKDAADEKEKQVISRLI